MTKIEKKMQKELGTIFLIRKIENVLDYDLVGYEKCWLIQKYIDKWRTKK